MRDLPTSPALDRAAGVRAVRIWDLPTRLFHWALTALVVFSFVTAKLGSAWDQWHFYSGYSILALLVFRLLWGFAGSRYARFTNFVRGPRAIVRFCRSSVHPPGHNPLGALSVVLLLAALLLQASVGLFATDDIASQGPLARLVSNSTSDLLSRVHRWNEKVLLGLLALHVAAVLWYRWARRIDLIGPMIGGDQRHAHAVPARDDAALRWRAVVLLALSAGLVAWIVNL